MGVSRSRIYLLVSIGISLSAISCVTINVGDNDLSKADGIQFSPPPSPFQELKTSSADEAWQNKATGSSISFVSSCGESQEPTLEQIRKTTIDGIANIEITKEEKMNFNQREALDSIITGKVDGVAIQSRILIFKKNNCNYSISYVSLKEKFQNEQSVFENFLRSFKAP